MDRADSRRLLRGAFAPLPALLYPVWTACPEQTTPLSQGSSGFVTVIHPYHPLCGQAVEIIRVRRGDDPDLIIRHPDGFHMAIAMSCTDYAGPSPHNLNALSPPALLDFACLCQLAQFIAKLRQPDRLPPKNSDRDTGEDGL